MSIYKARWFDRWARKQGLNTPALCVAVREMAEGLYDADLGGGLAREETCCQTRSGKKRWISHPGGD